MLPFKKQNFQYHWKRAHHTIMSLTVSEVFLPFYHLSSIFNKYPLARSFITWWNSLEIKDRNIPSEHRKNAINAFYKLAEKVRTHWWTNGGPTHRAGDFLILGFLWRPFSRLDILIFVKKHMMTILPSRSPWIEPILIQIEATVLYWWW